MTGEAIATGAQGQAGSARHADAINFDAPAVLRKWPSLGSQRRPKSSAPYLLIDGTLDQCIINLMARPSRTRHLYEIHTSAQSPLVKSVLSPEDITELVRLRDFL